MKIGVLSDTHALQIDQLPTGLVKALEKLDMIVHLGDYTGRGLMNDLKSLGEFRGVSGNMDPPSFQEELPKLDVIELNGKRLGLVHILESQSNAGKRVMKAFEGVDAVLYGHTHTPENEFVDGVLFLNPGSASGKFPALCKTHGIIHVVESITGEIITIES